MLGFLIIFDTIHHRSKEQGLLQLVWLDSGVQSHNIVSWWFLRARLERDRLPHRVKAMLDATE